MHAVATPANAMLQQLARELAITRTAPGSIPVSTILERLERSASMSRLH